MSTESERYLQRQEARALAASPAMQRANQIDARHQEQRQREIKSLGEQARKKLDNHGLRIGELDWDRVGIDGASFDQGVAYDYMTESNPNRYMLGVDLATGRSQDSQGMLSRLSDPANAEDLPWYKDVGNFLAQIPGGAGEAIVNTRQTLGHLRADLGVPEIGMDAKVDEMLTEWGHSDEEMKDPALREAARNRVVALDAHERRQAVRDMFPQPQNIPAQFARPLSQFLTANVPLMRMMRAAGVGAKVADIAAGGVASTLVWEHGEPTLANMLTEFDSPVLNNAVTQYLAIQDDDSDAERQLKRAFEDMGMNVAARGVISVLRTMKTAPWGKLAHLEVKGYTMLQDLHRGRKLFYGGGPSTEEMQAWVYILAGKIGKGLSKDEFARQAAGQYDEGTRQFLWDSAEEIANNPDKYAKGADVLEMPQQRPGTDGIQFGEQSLEDLGIEDIVISGPAPDRPLRGEGPKAAVLQFGLKPRK